MQLLAAVNGSAALFLVGLLLVVGVLLMRAQRTLKRSVPAPLAPLSHAARMAVTPGETTLPTDAPRELARWEVAMHEVAREQTARLDTKIAALQQLIQTAQHESRRLEALLADAGRLGLNRRADAPAPTPAPHAAPSQVASGQVALGTIPAAAAGASSAAQRRAEGRPYDRIYALADAGHDRAAIARQLGLPAGEVDLVLDLRRTK